jgi:hypothetical protein
MLVADCSADIGLDEKLLWQKFAHTAMITSDKNVYSGLPQELLFAAN